MNNNSHDCVRLSDDERNNAVSALGQALGEGRLTMAEFDERCTAVARATTQRELAPIFTDIPQKPSDADKVYSHADIENWHRSARKTKLGVALLTSLFGLAAGPAAITTGVLTGATALGISSGLFLLFLVPAVWIALYIMRIGPASWHAPSPRALERQRLREITAASRAQRAEIKAQGAQQWAERRQQASDLTGDAISLAKRQLDRWNKK